MEFKVGDMVQGEIIDFTHEGNGVMKIDNFAIFVPGGVIGDKVEVKIHQLKKNYGLGRITKVMIPSSDRVNEDIIPLSGATPLMNYDYNKQLQWKRQKVENDLKKFAGLSEIKIHETIGMDNPSRYRNHVQIPVGMKEGKAVLGFFERGSHDVVAMEDSILLPEIGEQILSVIKNWIGSYNIKPYNKSTNKGLLRHIGIRTNKDNQAMVILVTKTNKLPKQQELVAKLKEIDRVISIYHNINDRRNGPTYGKEYVKLFGEDELLDYLKDYKFKISPDSFFQVNRTQAEVLYDKAMAYLDPRDRDIVFDIYCGIGTISLYIADKAKKVYGIESIKAAIDDAKKNAELNNVENAEFVLGKAEEIFPKLMEQGIKGNKVVLDPPRKGCEKALLEALTRLSPERIVYVSCNPSTMARDVDYLVCNGYMVEEVQPVDLFPMTGHVESIILMTYCGSREG